EVKFVAPTLSFVYRDGAGVSVLTGALSDDGQTVSGQHLEQDAKHPFELVRADGRAGGPAAELHDLTGADAFRKIFNDDADRIRLLLILSPSCGLCQENAQMVERRVLDKVKDAHLRVYVLWAP